MQTVPVLTTIRCCCVLACAWLLTACPPWPAWEGCQDAAGCESTAMALVGSTGAPPLPTTGDSVQTVTGGDESSSGAALATETSGTTTSEPGESGESGESGEPGEPDKPPKILKVTLAPNPIHFNGAIAVTVTTEHTEGVHMVLGTPDKLPLKHGKPDLFDGEIPVFSGLDNGEHTAQFTPWRNGVPDGAEVKAFYTVALPLPGSQIFWEADESIGPGQVEALGVLPDGDVVEFGTHHPQGAPRCYLRRRDSKGMLGPDALEAVLPDSDCSAVDMKIDAQGALFVLVHRQTADGLLWWAGRIPAWGLGATKLGSGVKGETAAALAHHASGTVAVCGSAPTAMDVDAMVQIFRPNLPVEPWTLDYQPEDKPAHWFDERTRDCVFMDDSLALVGEAYGRHALEVADRERLFILRLDLEAKSSTWTVAPPGAETQSGAQAVAVGEQGRLVVAGYTCEDACEPEGDLRIYDASDTLLWQVPLGVFKTKGGATQDLAWSPAGYAVVATGGLMGTESAFTVRAFAQSQVGPLWTFVHKDLQLFHLALALAIGRYGEVYAGGLGANGHPAVAYIAG